MAFRTIAAVAAAGAAFAALSAQAARVDFGDLEPAQQEAACAALAQSGSSETIYVVSQPPADVLTSQAVGGMLTDIFTGEIDFVATRVASGDC
ncbi:MAG: hypothetical protein AAF684_00250 [Pseudomonadota bacterium]